MNIHPILLFSQLWLRQDLSLLRHNCVVISAWESLIIPVFGKKSGLLNCITVRTATILPFATSYVIPTCKVDCVEMPEGIHNPAHE